MTNLEAGPRFARIWYIVAGWIKTFPFPKSLVLLLGFGANHSLLFIVQYLLHHMRLDKYNTLISKHDGSTRLLVEIYYSQPPPFDDCSLVEQKHFFAQVT